MRFVFENPSALYLLLALPVWWALAWPRTGGGIAFARGDSARRIAGPATGRSTLLLFLPRILRTVALACAVLALAHPQQVSDVEETIIPGKGIGMALDISSSMLAEDMEDGRTRIDVAREAAVEFARSREHDELSLVAFAGEAVTRVPPTEDRDLIVQGVESLDIHLVRDGSDVSQALLASIHQLMESERDPRVVVLLSDGAHNGIRVQPLAAARAAQAMGIRVHGISILGPEDQIRPRFRSAGTADETTALEGVAAITGGRYFRATDGAALDSIYRVINELEASGEEIRTREERNSRRALLLVLALAFLGMETALRGSRWGVIS